GGFLVTIFRMDSLWSALRVADSAKGYRVEVSEGSRRIYESEAASAADASLIQTASVLLPGVLWTVRAQPPRELLRPLILAIMLAGAIVAMLLPFSTALAQAARLRAREAEAARARLESEIRE